MDINQNNIYGNNNINIGPQQRRLDDNSKLQLRNMLNKAEKIKIASVMGDPEARNLAEETKSYLLSEGYTVEGINSFMGGSAMKGQEISNILHDGYRLINIGHQ